ncbi:hypothetical protein ACLK1U_01745 [Escherichia coli]
MKDEPLTLLKNVRGLELLTFAEQDAVDLAARSRSKWPKYPARW